MNIVSDSAFKCLCGRSISTSHHHRELRLAWFGFNFFLLYNGMWTNEPIPKWSNSSKNKLSRREKIRENLHSFILNQFIFSTIYCERFFSVIARSNITIGNRIVVTYAIYRIFSSSFLFLLKTLLFKRIFLHKLCVRI